MTVIYVFANPSRLLLVQSDKGTNASFASHPQRESDYDRDCYVCCNQLPRQSYSFQAHNLKSEKKSVNFLNSIFRKERSQTSTKTQNDEKFDQATFPFHQEKTANSTIFCIK
jgi:hypothetical protein